MLSLWRIAQLLPQYAPRVVQIAANQNAPVRKFPPSGLQRVSSVGEPKCRGAAVFRRSVSVGAGAVQMFMNRFSG